MVIIGEKINGSLPVAKVIIQQRDQKTLLDIVRKQAEAGADFVDVNVGTGESSQSGEAAAMKWAVETIQKEMEVPLCIDSSDGEVIETGLKARKGRLSLINSTNAESNTLKAIVPLAVRFEVPIVALAMGGDGIPETAAERLEACQKIADTCTNAGLSLKNVYFDPLVLPVSTDVSQGKVTLNTLQTIKKTFPEAMTVMGLSNISYGLPKRNRINAAFLHMAIFAGLDAAIMDPTEQEMMGAVKAGDALLGKDRHCRRYTRFVRIMK